MLVQPTEEEGEVSERPSESQPIPSPTHTSEDQFEPQSDQSLRPSSSIPISDSNPESSGGNHGEIKGLKAQIKQLKKNARPGRKAVKSSKGAPSVHTHTDWDDMDTDFEASLDEVIDYTPAQNKGNEGTDKQKESIDKQNGGTDGTKQSIDRQVEGTAATPTAPTITSIPTLTIFGNDETIAQLLVTMSQKKLKLKEKEKGVELKNVKNIKRSRPT
ncbi:hypothetical protein Tco_1024038, partial [Tanacetum coccineum]